LHVFSEASQRGADRLKNILDVYNRGSRQLVNRDKSAIFFSANCLEDAKTSVQNRLDIQIEALAERYLGLPTTIGRSTKEAFEYPPSRVRGVIESWSNREASCAGREILLKSVAQAMPTYSMSCFLLPVDTNKKVRQAIANFWWGSSVDNKHIHWMKWDHLTIPKCDGGMGFRDMRMFNLAMLGKQGRWLMTRPDSLCSQVLKGHYFHDSDFTECSRKKYVSCTCERFLLEKKL
jgi:hypothetical protein